MKLDLITTRMDELGVIARQRMEALAHYPEKSYAEIMHMTQEEFCVNALYLFTSDVNDFGCEVAAQMLIRLMKDRAYEAQLCHRNTGVGMSDWIKPSTLPKKFHKEVWMTKRHFHDSEPCTPFIATVQNHYRGTIPEMWNGESWEFISDTKYRIMGLDKPDNANAFGEEK